MSDYKCVEIDQNHHVIQENLPTEECYNWDITKSTFDSLKYKDFFNNFLLKNLPCIIKNVTSHWNCTRNWILVDGINHDYFTKAYGDLIAPVADCSNIIYNSQRKSQMKISDYMDYLKCGEKPKLLYLKDWHLKRINPADNFYEVPLYFSSDWLNEYAVDKDEDDFRFVYIGPKHSWTPLHSDVYSSYSWSVNVVGQKEWIFFPPGEEEKLKDSLGNLPLTYDCHTSSDIKYYKIVQEKGDAIFVPSGWHHQVINLQDTISINHNWINGCNIELVWKSLKENLSAVEHEIEDLKESPEFSNQCQLILKTNFGMDYEMFICLICHLAKRRLSQYTLETLGMSEYGHNGYQLGHNHIIFDLRQINKIMGRIESETDKDLFINIKHDLISLRDAITKTINNVN